MELKQFLKKQTVLQNKQRLIAIGVGLLVLSNFLLALIAFTLSHRSQTILVPMNLNEPVTVSSRAVSPEYLSLMAQSLVAMRFDFDSRTISNQYKLLERFVAPELKAQMGVSFETEAKSLSEQGIDSSFKVMSIEPNTKQLTVRITGMLERFVQGAPMTPVQTVFILSFQNHQGILLLNGWLEEKK